jgi:hypothetical protein
MSATVDGGDLAWKLTQMSAGIKMFDPKTKDLLSGELLFGESGHTNVQSQSVCYPLHIIIAKDNKELYQRHLNSFFREINTIKDQHPNSIKFIQGAADMCSLQKTLNTGKLRTTLPCSVRTIPLATY